VKLVPFAGATRNPIGQMTSELHRPKRHLSVEIYDNFDKPGYSLPDYAERWITPYGLGEMTVNDTRDFSDGCLNLAAVPFNTASDVAVNDHLKYMAVSSRAFPVPEDGTLVLSSDIKASTPGTVPGLIQHGVYGPSGSWLDPANPPMLPGYRARLLQGQQAAVVMNVLDFCTGQLFDWFISSDTAFALIERLPTAVTGNVTNPDCREATEVGIDKMYTQIVREVPVRADVWHHVDIALTRHDGDLWVDYFLDHQPIAHVENVGIPLDKQGATFTGIYRSLGSGERLADRLDSVRFGHGLFSLLDAFPFQHPGAPELSISIPTQSPPSPRAAGRARLFGQGAKGAFDNFTTLTISESARPSSPAEILNVLAGNGRVWESASS
jgi:Family of unknown function (DUF6081)